jgi:hypothetical protein
VLGLGEPPLGKVRQFEIVEEKIEEFLAGEGEAERILVAFPHAAVPASSPTFGGPWKNVALHEVFISGEHKVPNAAGPPVESRLVHPVKRDADFSAFQDTADIAALRTLTDGALHQCPSTPEEPLPILEALAARVQAPVDDVHGISGILFSRFV